MKKSENTFVDIGKKERYANFQQKIFNSKLAGAFQITFSKMIELCLNFCMGFCII